MKTLPTIPPARPTPRGGLLLNFGRHDRIVINGCAFTCEEITPQGYVLARADNPLITETFTRDEMEAHRRAPGFSHDHDFYNPGAQKARLLGGVVHLRDLSEKEQADILWKQDWCTRFITKVAEGVANRSDGSMEKIIKVIKAEMDEVEATKSRKGKKKIAGQETKTTLPPSVTFLRKWVKKLIAGGMNPLALRDQRHVTGGNWTSRYDTEVYAIMWKHVCSFASPEQPTRIELHERMEIEIRGLNEGRPKFAKLKIPKYPHFCKEVEKLSAFDVKAGREGVDVAKKFFHAVTGGLVDVVRPLQRVEIDEWDVHLHILFIRAGLWDTLTDAEKKQVERVRMVLCVAIDCATRCILAMSLARTPSSSNAIRVLDMGLSEKQDYADTAGALTPWDMYGTWETVVADAGKSFAGHEFSVRVIDAGITLEIAAAGVPFLRGTIERSWRSMDNRMVKRFAGRTGSNVVDKGDYDSQGRASLNLDELAEAFVRYHVDYYHNHPHEGLRGESPRACWLRLTELYGVMPPPDAAKRRAIFGVPMRATADADGIRVLGIQFQAAEVHNLFMTRGPTEVELRLDPKDFGAISAKIGKGWLTIDGPEALRGVYVEDWIAADAELRRRHADMNKLTRPIVLQAAKYLNDLADNARQRVNIADRPISALALARAQRNMRLGVSFVADEKAAREANVGLFDDALEVTGPGFPDAPPEAAKSPGKARKAPAAPKAAKRAKAAGKAPRGAKTKAGRWKYE
jgi:putative transposase